ncbi:MAG: shikimate dehydrogenase [Deltaproteobacteria bacterium]|nr:shikimate dehydrogenase [Deltaproteobacteria bacterium]
MWKHITSETLIYGIMGKPVNHSLSPKIHNTVFRLAEIDAVYLPFQVASSRVEAAIAGLRALNISGVNVTIPHKEAVFKYLDQLDDAARHIGAVNTITIRDGRLFGANTDWSGFADSLERHQLNPAGRRIAVLGSGGSARAVLYALGENNCKEIEIFNRTFEKAVAMAGRFSRLFPETRFKASQLEDFFQDGQRQSAAKIPDMVIDTLPGSIPFNPPEWLQRDGDQGVYYTINYGPAAERKKAPAGWTRINGLEMLIHQAMRSFLIWMGNRFSLTEAEKLYEKAFEDLRSQT